VAAPDSLVDLDPLGAQARGDPYPYYRQLRERAPVCWSPASRSWIVTRHDDAVRLLADPRVCHWAVADEPREGAGDFPRTLARWLASMDPRFGARLRTLTAPVFSRLHGGPPA
jgi:hypothetical protein